MIDTPRMNEAAGVPTNNWEPVAERCYEAGCKLERELNAKNELISNLCTQIENQASIIRTSIKPVDEVHAAMLKELQELRDESERMDWLIEHAWEIWYYGRDRVGEPRAITNMDNLRETIDSQIALTDQPSAQTRIASQ